jgi:hypothetical protein
MGWWHKRQSGAQCTDEVITADLACAGVSKIWKPKVEPSGTTALAALITSALDALPTIVIHHSLI